MKEDHALIRLTNVSKAFQTAAGPTWVLKDVSVQIAAGEFVTIIGRSGSGKSTLLNMITGIDRPTRGEVCVDGVSLNRLSEGQFSVWRGRSLGIVFQFFQLLPTLTLLENLLLPMDFAGCIAPAQREARARKLLERVGLEALADQLPTQLSGGQQQSAAVARALANDPPLIVADEPTGNLDSRAAEAVFALFLELVQEGKTVLMVTHDAAMAQRAPRTLVLCDGELINEWLARALPDVAHPELLRLTHALRPWSGGAVEPGLWLVQAGALEVLDRRGTLTRSLTAGQWAVLSPSLHVRAGAELRAWCLPQGELSALLAGTPELAARLMSTEPARKRWPW
ncbi:MAG: ABC transporter ATP-binding protein [Anaerolinea sp.]|nr:ABC transporter ATP-binding protein [Anaerolinea sp.]